MNKIRLIVAIILATAIFAHGASYKEVLTPIAGDKQTYPRAARINIDNTYGQVPSAEFTTEHVTIYPDGQYINKFYRRTTLRMDNPAEEVDLYDPTTGAKVGKISAGEAYAVLFSLWAESERRADYVPPPPEPIVESPPETIPYTTSGN